MLILEKIGNGYIVYYYNDVKLGVFEFAEDGFLYFWPKDEPSAWNAHVMRKIADKLDELNAAWKEQIIQCLDSAIGRRQGT